MFYSASQIAKEFEIERFELDPVEIELMHRVWADFYKTILGPQQLREESFHPTDCTMFTCQHHWDDRCKTKWQEMWQWDDYMLQHYKPPQVKGRGLEQILS